MDAHIKKVYVPMTETSFYILLCLRTPNHGYGIVQKVKELTDNEVVLGPGTMDGEGWSDSFYSGGRQEEDLRDHRTWHRSSGA